MRKDRMAAPLRIRLWTPDIVPLLPGPVALVRVTETLDGISIDQVNMEGMVIGWILYLDASGVYRFQNGRWPGRVGSAPGELKRVFDRTGKA